MAKKKPEAESSSESGTDAEADATENRSPDGGAAPPGSDETTTETPPPPAEVKLYVIIGKQIYLGGQPIGELHTTRGAARKQIKKLNEGGK